MPPAVKPDNFLTELHKMFERTKAKGSISLTTSRTNLKSRNTRKPDPAAQSVCLIRASDGKKKITTTVSTKDYPRFIESYGTILKAHMDGLRKRERVRGGGAAAGKAAAGGGKK